MRHLTRVAAIVILTWAINAVAIPVVRFLSYEGQLMKNKSGETRIVALGEFAAGQLSIIDYVRSSGGGESVFHERLWGQDVRVDTFGSEDGPEIIRVQVDDKVYRDDSSFFSSFSDNPSVVAKAERALNLGRKRFAEAQARLNQN